MHEVSEEWRKLHREKPRDLYFSPNEPVFRVMKNNEIGGGHDTHERKETYLYDIDGKLKGRLRRRGKDDDDDDDNNNKHFIKCTILYYNKTKTPVRRKKE